MKLLIVACLVAFACGDVSHILKNTVEKDAVIVKQGLDVSPDGGYSWEIETSNGIAANAEGKSVQVDAETSAQVVQGSSSWTSPEGEQISFQYVADQNGYQPQGSHIPTPPPIPEAILRALEYIRAHPPPLDQ